MARDLPHAKRGQEILPVVNQIIDRVNRKIEGPGVLQAPQGWWIDRVPQQQSTLTIEIWELTEYPVYDTDTKEYKATAKRVSTEKTSGFNKYEADAAKIDTVWFPAFIRKSSNIILRCPPGFTTLSRVNCIRSQEGRLVVLDGLPRIIEFELKTNLTAGSTATAYLVKEDGATDTSVTFTVYDAPEGCRRAYGRDTTNTVGAKGKASIGASGYYEIVSMKCLSERIKVTIGSSAWTAGATYTSANISALVVMDEGQDPSNGTPGSITIQNGSSDIPANTSGVVCVWDQTLNTGTGRYLATYQASSPVMWGIVTSNPTNIDGNTQLSVTVNNCTSDGTVTSGSNTVYTPMLAAGISGTYSANKFTAVFTGDVVGFVPTTGTKAFTIVTPCFDDPFGTVRFLTSVDNEGATAAKIPNGWVDITSTWHQYLPMADKDQAGGVLNNGDEHTHGITVGVNTNTCIAVGAVSTVTSVTSPTAGALTTSGGYSGAGSALVYPPTVSVKVIYRKS